MKRRRNYLIKKRMQLGLTLRFTIVIVLFSFFIGLEVYITIWPVVSEFIPEKLLGQVWQQIFFRGACFIFPILFVVGVLSILLSHRIAGPLYRIERTLDKIIQGEDTEFITLRKGDELQDLAGRINELMIFIKGHKNSADHIASENKE